MSGVVCVVRSTVVMSGVVCLINSLESQNLMNLVGPFQTVLRVWDCFLLEGPKVLFRMALAVLRLQEQCLLQKTDTISFMRHLKCGPKLLFDSESLLKVYAL